MFQVGKSHNSTKANLIAIVLQVSVVFQRRFLPQCLLQTEDDSHVEFESSVNT